MSLRVSDSKLPITEHLSQIRQSMSLEEKIGQLLLVHFQGEKANEDARTMIQDVKVGGIVYYNWSNGLHSPEQVKALSSSLQDLATKNRIALPLLIAADQEGGIVARLNQGFTAFPGNRALAMTRNPALAKAAALAMGREMRAVGVNMNLAPVVDVNIKPQNPVIGVRSYGDNAKTVITFGKEALSGFKEAGVLTTLKHFPGHGDVRVDSHKALPRLEKPLTVLEKTELLPFTELSPLADAVMTGHLLVPAFDTDNCSTLSERTLTYLKQQIGFEGPVITDSLVMEGVLEAGHINTVAIRALKAGCDMLCLGGKQLVGSVSIELEPTDVKRIHAAIIQAVRSNEISEERINDAVDRVLKLKRGLYTKPVLSELNLDQHYSLAKQIANEAIEVISNCTERIYPIGSKNASIFAPDLLRREIKESSFPKIGATASMSMFAGLSPSVEDAEMAKFSAKTADVLCIFSYNAWKNPAQATLIQSLLEIGKPVILIAVRDPLDASLFPQADLIIKTFSPVGVSLEAACDRIKKMEAYTQ